MIQTELNLCLGVLHAGLSGFHHEQAQPEIMHVIPLESKILKQQNEKRRIHVYTINKQYHFF